MVIMAGGIGSRFWPLSTPEFPKQFIDILGCGRTLIQLTVDRFKGICPERNFWVVTNRSYVDIVKEQIPGIPAGHILAEPAARNTAPCIAWACWSIRQEDPDANVVVTPADAVVMNPVEFQRVIKGALEFTSGHDFIVTIGIKPNRPETGALGIAVDFQKGITPEQLAQINTMSGKIITDAGYMSVGYQIDSQFADSPVMLTLLCDEGTPVMVTDNFAESELVFPRNTSYMILGVIPHNDQDSHKLVIGSNIQPQNKDAPQFNVSFNGVEIICKVQNSKGNPDIKSQSAGAFGDFKSKQQSYEGYFGQHDDVHRPAYLKMANADKASLTPEEAAAMDEYTTDSGDINRRLRGQDDVDDELQHTVSTIKGAMAKHPLPVELTTFRGVDDGMLTYLLNTCDGISPEDKDNCLAEDGSIDHEKMFSTGAYKCFEGCLYRDAAFVSTSTNRFFAKRWANDITNDGLARKYQRMADAETDPTRKKELKKQASITGDKGSKAHFQDITGSHIFIMNLKKGTRGMFSDTMYTKNGVGRGQDEFTLDSGYMYKITNVTPAAKGQYEFTVEVVL